MPTIERRAIADGTVSYRVRVRLKGAAVASATFARKTDAKKWAHATEVAIREGRYFKTAAAQRCTLAEVIDRYVAEVLPRKPRTAKFQARQLAWWRAQLGHLFLCDVTASAIAEARAILLAAPIHGKRARGHSTANRYLAALSHVLTIAVQEWELLESNAARKLRKFAEPATARRIPLQGGMRRAVGGLQQFFESAPARRRGPRDLDGYAAQRDPATSSPARRRCARHDLSRRHQERHATRCSIKQSGTRSDA